MVSRQEIVNVVLAQVLHQRGLIAAPEQILRRHGEESRLPDVLVDFQGLRLAIEAEFASTPRASQKAYNKALQRIEQGVAHIGLAVVYPEEARNADLAQMAGLLTAGALRYAVATEINTEQVQRELFEAPPADPSFYSGGIGDIADAIRRCYEQLVEDQTLARVVDLLTAAMQPLTNALGGQPGVFQRLAAVIGVRDLKISAAGPKRRGAQSRQIAAVCRIAALIVANAMIFQEVLSSHNKQVRSLSNFRGREDILGALTEHWGFILAKVNYWPIFSAAHQVISSMSSDDSVRQAIDRIAGVAARIVTCRAPLRHDLAGRIFHTLLEEAKYLGAYYTAIPSAALLLKLALRPDRLAIAWHDVNALRALRVADLACGTGTLLMAGADAIIDNYIRACVNRGGKPDLIRCHRALVEDTLFGYDVLASAVHLTASTLSLRVPEEPINTAHLYRMELGGPSRMLGTLELLDRDTVVTTLFGQPEQVGARGPRLAERVGIPDLDLCAMNPPFTRSVGHNLLFGNLPDAERKPMQARLQKLLRGQDASATAGLGAPFVLLGDRHVKRGAVMALVLPRALTSGVAWGPTRRLIEKHYDIEYLIVSSDPTQWNFSENTSLSEVLFVGRKRLAEDGPRPAAVCVNLWRQPRTSIEALSIARGIIEQPTPSLLGSAAVLEIDAGGKKAGEAYSVPQERLAGDLWASWQAFAQVELNRLYVRLREGRLEMAPGRSSAVPLARLSSIGKLGFDRRDVHDAFELALGRSKYPSLWGHDSTALESVACKPNRWLRPLAAPKAGRPARAAEDIWTGCGRVLIAERLWLNTIRIAATRCDRPVLSNVWWPFTLRDVDRAEQLEKALVLWMNSTLGLVLLAGQRVETRGAWIQFKKPTLGQLMVLDIANLQEDQLAALGAVFDSVAHSPLLRCSQLAADPVRMRIDKALSDILGLGDLAPVREALAHEPIVTLKRLNGDG